MDGLDFGIISKLESLDEDIKNEVKPEQKLELINHKEAMVTELMCRAIQAHSSCSDQNDVKKIENICIALINHAPKYVLEVYVDLMKEDEKKSN